MTKDVVLSLLRLQTYWLSWNLYLAFVPLVLSVLLFRSRGSRSWLWWLQLLGFFAFLPNAPYLLTDVIHLNVFFQIHNALWLILLVVIPVYLLLIIAGFESYVLSLINLGYYLKRIGRDRWILTAELLTHFLCAIGVYLGRFARLNSWYLITKPQSLLRSTNTLLSFDSLRIIAITFVVLASLYWIMKQVNLKIRFARGTRNGQNS